MSSCRQCGWPWIERDGLCRTCLELRAHPDPLSKRTTLGKIPFQDMKQLDEADRITLIVGHLKKHPGKDIAVLVDCGEGHADKGDRYIKAIREQMPSVKLIKRSPGPIPEGETIILRN